MSHYDLVKRWRKQPRNKGYNASYMSERRQFFREAYKKGLVKFEDIPVSYRTFSQKYGHTKRSKQRKKS